MRKTINKWKNLLLIPLLCAALVLMTGCGGKDSGESQVTLSESQENTVSVTDEAREESESREETVREESSDSSYDNEEDNDTGGEDGENSDYMVDTGDNTYSEGVEEGSWNEFDEESRDSGEDDPYQDENGDGEEEYTGEEGYSEDTGETESSEAEGEGSSNGFEQYYGSSGEIDENGIYTTAEDVALYIHTFGKLPCNFMTKAEAKRKGWSGGSLENYVHGMCIGGDEFHNYEGILPKGKYHECDINTLGNTESRGPERLVYSDDGRIYYTADHYETFTLLYGSK